MNDTVPPRSTIKPWVYVAVVVGAAALSALINTGLPLLFSLWKGDDSVAWRKLTSDEPTWRVESANSDGYVVAASSGEGGGGPGVDLVVWDCRSEPPDIVTRAAPYGGATLPVRKGECWLAKRGDLNGNQGSAIVRWIEM